MANTKAALSVGGILVLAAMFLVGTRDEPTVSPFQYAALHLRVGMTTSEVHAIAQIPRQGLRITASFDYASQWVTYFDPQRRESLSLEFVDDDLGWSRLAKWELSRHR
jgi:hypothetical protein